DVLGRVDRDVDPPFEERALELGYPAGLVIEVLSPATGRRDRDNLNISGGKQPPDRPRLPQRERAPARADPHQVRRLPRACPLLGSSRTSASGCSRSPASADSSALS